MASLLRFDQLSYERNEQAVFAPISGALVAGDLLQITGANGCGKSTLLRLLAGLLTPATGKIHITADTKLLYIGHHNGIHASLTARENLAWVAGLFGIKLTPEKMDHVLTTVGIVQLADIQTSQFSAGQARRLALARLLCIPADIWLLDEPTTSLDRAGQQWLAALITAKRTTGGIVIMTSHAQHAVPVSANLVCTIHHQPCPSPATRVNTRNYHSALALTKYNLLTTVRAAAAWLTPLLFFTIALTLFAIAAGPDIRVQQTLAPAIIWVTALLAILLSIDTLFRTDMANGTIDLLLTSPYSPTLAVGSKIFSHWLAYCLPLILLSPLAGLLLGLSPHMTGVLLLSLFCGTPILSLTGSIGAALVAGIRGHGLLLPVLIMPLYIPTLIFGIGMMDAANAHQPLAAEMAVLLAFSLLGLATAPLLSSLALRNGVNQ